MTEPEFDPAQPSKPSKTSESDYEVGYGRPPKTTRFKPGQSGNRNGRPKGAQNLITILDKELNSRVSVTENGRRKSVRKKEVIAKQLVNKAAAGDLKATMMVISQTGGAAPAAPAAAGEAETGLAREDERVLENILERLRRNDAQRVSGQIGAGDSSASGPPPDLSDRPDLSAPDTSAGEDVP